MSSSNSTSTNTNSNSSSKSRSSTKRSFSDAMSSTEINSSNSDQPSSKRTKIEAASSNENNKENKEKEKEKEQELTLVQGSSQHKTKTVDPSDPANHLIWVDCEMTGLDLTKNYICEIAVVVTDCNLNVIKDGIGPNMVIKQTKQSMEDMSDWCKNEFGKSGLTKSINESKIDFKTAEKEIISFLEKHKLPRKTIPLCGNSIHADKKFIDKDMPLFKDYLHYRLIDVSTIKELTRRWFPDDFDSMPPKKKGHRALDDIKESLEELKLYRQLIFKQ